jgi:hypothetical protein
MLIQQNNKIFFPEGSSDVEEDTDEFGLAVFEYKLKPASTSSLLFLYIGIAGIVLAFVAFLVFGMKKSATA